MNLSFYIARRYLFSKKSHNAINIISMVCVCGVVIATTAVVCALSVYNGFNDLVADMFSSFDPELKITPRTGKVFDPTTAEFQQVKQLPDIAYFGEVLQDNALIRYHDRQDVAIIKGVDDNFSHLTQIDSVLIDGSFILKDEVTDYAILGVGLSSKLGAKPGFASPLEIYVPKRNEKVNLSNPASSFSQEYAYIGGVFMINQQVYDEGYMILPLSLVRELYKYDKEVTSIELKIADGANISSVKKQLKSILDDRFIIQDRYEQQEASFKMMQVEKWITYLILSFILTIALFNVVGSLSMLMIEKKDDVHTLRNMGADNKLIRRIFLFEGWMISGFGALIGIVIGLALCFLQRQFGLIKLGQTAGAFIIDAYPVRVMFTDALIAFITVAAIGFMAAWYPVHYLGKKWFN